MTLTPIYGRDYKSKAAVLADFDANKDFIIQGADVPRQWDGKLCNKSSLLREGVHEVSIRFSNLRKQIIHHF